MTPGEIRELRDYADRLENTARWQAGVGHQKAFNDLKVDALREEQRIVDLIRKVTKEVEAA